MKDWFLTIRENDVFVTDNPFRFHGAVIHSIHKTRRSAYKTRDKITPEQWHDFKAFFILHSLWEFYSIPCWSHLKPYPFETLERFQWRFSLEHYLEVRKRYGKN